MKKANRCKSKRRKRKLSDQFTMKVTPDNVQIEEIEDHLLDAVLASHEVDAAADKEWFRQHPGQVYRVRPCSQLEIAAGNHPDAKVQVVLFPCGAQVRIVTGPGG